jgi:K+-transporting ATPase A subunit
MLTIGTVLIVGALSYFPVLSLGPIVEQLALR